MGASSETHEAPQKKLDHDHHSKNCLKDIKNKGVLLALIFYVLLSVICAIAALALLVVTGSATVFAKVYDSEAKGRIAGAILLMISAAIAIATVIYGIIATCKKKNNPLRVVSIILGLLVIFQILLVGFSVHFKREDDIALTDSLTKSFDRAHNDLNTTDTVYWNTLQHSFNCCGLHGPEDYHNPDDVFLPPRVPFSCCPKYKENQTETAVNTWERDICIMKASYYKIGCLKEATTAFKDIVLVTVNMSIFVIIIEAAMLAIGYFLSRKQYEANHKNKDSLPGPSPVA